MNKCLLSRSEITSLISLDDSFLFATKLHGIKKISFDSCESKLHLAPRELNSKTTAIAFSSDAQVVAFANGSLIRIYYLATRKLIKTIKTDEGTITKLHFDTSTHYLIVGSSNGRVTLYREKHSTPLSRLHSFDYKHKNSKEDNNIDAITSYNSLVASSGDRGKIAIIDIHSQIEKNLHRDKKGSINALLFLDSKRLVSGDVDGVIEIHSIENHHNNKTVTTSLTHIKQIVQMSNPNYILVTSKSNRVLVIDINRAKVVIPKFLEFEDIIQQISLSKTDRLTVSLQNGALYAIKLSTPKDIEELLTKNRLYDALLIAENSIILKESQEYKKALIIYDKRIIKAVNALITNNKELAHTLTKEFRNIPSKKEEIVSLFRAFEHFARFRALVLEKKYALAYAMSSKYPALTYTPQYKKMEESWKTTFGDAQRQMILGRSDLAKAILNEYMTTITKRSLIKFVLNHNEQFLEFLKAIEKRQYLKVFTLVNENELFKQVPTFTTLNEDIEHQLNLVKEHINLGKLNAVKENLKVFKDIAHLKERVQELQTQSKYMQILQSHYKNDDFKSCYTTLDKYETLKSTELGVLLEKHWVKVISQCEEYALKGDLKSIKNELNELLFIESRKEKIGNLFRVSYHVKIKLLTAKKSYKKAEAVIYSYLDIFGIDKEITLLKEKFEKESSMLLAIEDAEIRKIKRDDWFFSKLLTP